MALLLAVASLPIMRWADPPTRPKGPRISSLDGLRGFLAFSVFFHHAAISHRYWLSGKWATPPSRFYTLLGQVGVSVFFMITGYLFWTKLLKEQKCMDWRRLYLGRLFRIGPVYWVAIGWMTLLVAIKSNFELHEPVSRVGLEVLRWSALGFFRGSDVNGLAGTEHLIAGVTWSLQYEWLFYFSLPLTAVFLHRKINDLALASCALGITAAFLLWHPPAFVVRSSPAVAALYFLAGMTCASLEKRAWLPRLSNWLSSGLALAIIATVFLGYDSANAAVPALLLSTVFVLIISGCDVFGLLRTVSARRLGDISYGIYLLQGLVLTVVLSIKPVRTFFIASPLNHWIVILAVAILLVITATVVHVFVEDPGVELGRKLSRHVTASDPLRKASA